MNAKRVRINGAIPFCFMDGTSENDRAFLCSMLLQPTRELTINYTADTVRYGPKNEYGGRTAYYGFRVSGVFGGHWAALGKLTSLLRQYGAEIEQAKAKDIEDTPSRWEEL